MLIKPEDQVPDADASIKYCESLINKITDVNDCKYLAANEPPLNPLDLAETHIASHFSTARLLQMKVWWDTLPHEETPKLAAVFAWTTGVTVQAAQGQTNFAAPPYTFDELLVEAVRFLVP